MFWSSYRICGLMARIFEGIPLMNSYYICIVAEANNIYSLSSSDFVIFLYIQIGLTRCWILFIRPFKLMVPPHIIIFIYLIICPYCYRGVNFLPFCWILLFPIKHRPIILAKITELGFNCRRRVHHNWVVFAKSANCILPAALDKGCGRPT